LNEVIYLQRNRVTYERPLLGNVPKYIAGKEKPDKSLTLSNSRSRFTVKD